jgi:thioredoxin 1
MADILELTEDNFNDTVATGVTLVDFWATWCGPCRMQGAVLDKLAPELGDKAKIGKVNVDDNQSLAVQFRVQSIPALFLFKNGEIVKEFTGLTRAADLLAAIDAAQ